MRIALIGATGNIGSRILAEALGRGHHVTGIARHPEKLSPRPGLIPARGDIGDGAALAKVLAGHDAVVTAIRFTGLKVAEILAPVRQSGVARLLIVGGAGSLEVAPGVQLVDTPQFPEIYKSEALPARDALNDLRHETALDWTFVSPSALIQPGERTGRFRLGGDQLLTDADGKSAISMEDFAVALVDEIETPQHVRRRFTVGY